MSNSKHIDIICIAAITISLIITVVFMFGEKLGIEVIHSEEDTGEMFTANDISSDWDTSDATEIILSENTATVNGNGAYYSDSTVEIVYAGKYVVSGAFNGTIEVDADGDDKIWILFDGVQISSGSVAPLYIKQAEKVFLTLKDGTESTLTYTNANESADTDGAVFSRDDLTVNGSGTLNIISENLHGIVCNDTLVFAGGTINIDAKADGVHAHDAIKICNTDITVAAGDDGLHAGNDDGDSSFYIESGTVNITECYEGIEANDIYFGGGNVSIYPSDDGINANGDGKNSIITIAGGEISIINRSGRDADGLDSNGSISITGGSLFVSVTGTGTNNAIDYGSENGGTFTVSGGTIIACGSSQMAECPESASTQGFISETVSGNENDTLTLTDSEGNTILESEIPCSFSFVVLSSPQINIGDTVTLKIGDTETQVTVDNVGTASGMSGFFGGNGMSGGGKLNERDGNGGNSSKPDSNGAADNNNGNDSADADNGTDTDNANGLGGNGTGGGVLDGGNGKNSFSGSTDNNGMQNSANGTPPAMTGNGDSNSTPPAMPDGNSAGGQMPDFSGNGTMPTPGENDGSLTIPSPGENDGSLTIPSPGENGEAPATPNGDAQNKFNENKQSDKSIASDNPQETNGKSNTSTAVSDPAVWLLISTSAFVLVIGLIIVFKKKY